MRGGRLDGLGATRDFHHGLLAGVITLALVGHAAVSAQQQEGFRFRSGVELINVTATVTDARGRFVEGLRQEDSVFPMVPAGADLDQMIRRPSPIVETAAD